MWTYAIFPFLLFFASAFILTVLPVSGVIQNYYRNRGRRSVKCFYADTTADVEVDHSFALRSALASHPQTRVASCSRWPTAGDCGQECLAQIEASPENLDRLLTKWYAGKSCATCARPLNANEWRHGRLAVLDREQKLLGIHQLGLEKLQIGLENTRPLCWKCYQEEGARQRVPCGASWCRRNGCLIESKDLRDEILHTALDDALKALSSRRL